MKYSDVFWPSLLYSLNKNFHDVNHVLDKLNSKYSHSCKPCFIEYMELFIA